MRGRTRTFDQDPDSRISAISKPYDKARLIEPGMFWGSAARRGFRQGAFDLVHQITAEIAQAGFVIFQPRQRAA